VRHTYVYGLAVCLFEGTQVLKGLLPLSAGVVK
jgi:hypothetical protein